MFWHVFYFRDIELIRMSSEVFFCNCQINHMKRSVWERNLERLCSIIMLGHFSLASPRSHHMTQVQCSIRYNAEKHQLIFINCFYRSGWSLGYLCCTNADTGSVWDRTHWGHKPYHKGFTSPSLSWRSSEKASNTLSLSKKLIQYPTMMFCPSHPPYHLLLLFSLLFR